MFLQQSPADTLSYMILGYVVILGTILLFVISLAWRFRNLARDLKALQDLEEVARRRPPSPGG
jgi:TRAP-type C4-dicarboxylate transport system permease small subunit